MRKWYVSDRWGAADKGKVQVGSELRNATTVMVPETILRRAHREYELRFAGQSYGRMQERGGLGVIEVIMLLADALETADAALGITTEDDK